LGVEFGRSIDYIFLINSRVILYRFQKALPGIFLFFPFSKGGEVLGVVRPLRNSGRKSTPGGWKEEAA
jgi:hypothetical protein